jgi:creatinine amidohydrolase
VFLSTAPERADDGFGSFDRLTTEDAAAASGSIVLVPIGAVEQHGPHLPLGTDVALASRIAADAAALVGGVLIAPPVPYGCSAHHRSFAGTVSLRVETFIHLLVDVASSLAADGFVPVFVNGHGGNRGPLGAGLQVLLEHGVDAWGVTYFELIADEALDEFDGDGAAMGHACALETSLSLANWPRLVHLDRVPVRSPGDRYPDPRMFTGDRVIRHRRFEDLSDSGIVGDPSKGNLSAGQRLHGHAVQHLAEILRTIRTREGEPRLASEMEDYD